MSAPDLLPDSRLSTPYTPRQARWRGQAWWVPIYCPSCGKPGGEVPQENMTFAYWICPDCHAKHGAVTQTMAVPDDVFWQAVEQEQQERYGRVLAPEELQAVVEADASPLATLIHEGASLQRS